MLDQAFMLVIFVLVVIAAWGQYNNYRMVSVLHQLERDRFYIVRYTQLMTERLWDSLESLGVSLRARDNARREIEAELEHFFGIEPSSISVSLKNDKAGSPESMLDKASSRSSPRPGSKTGTEKGVMNDG
jgi:hypothetical protein